MKAIIHMDREDVRVARLPKTPCDDCRRPATHEVRLTLRAVGNESPVYQGCASHAYNYAKRLKASLPKGRDDE